MDNYRRAQKTGQSTLDDFFLSGSAEERLAGMEWSLDEDEDLMRFIRGGLAAK
ncbi:hypothetical protein [Methanocella conradii]|uniref:hypothetical protein n=1 Tax=Methanocella conradii TaxID=1175444 RepID=UPI00157E050F|nr:hypothetical protein [Methanocella conradii]